MPRSVVGLDIGSAAVRAVEIRRGGSHADVHRSGSVPLPAGAVEGGLVRDAAAVAAALRELWSQAKFTTRAVRLGVGSASVLVRQLELDWMPDADLRRSLRYQVGDLLPVPVDDANLDHVLLGERSEAGDGVPDRRIARILLVATARSAVDDLTHCVHTAKLRPVAADLAPFALVRLAQRCTPQGAEPGAEAIIDIGVDKVSVTIHDDGRPHFVRVVPGIGGGLLTRVLVEQTERSYEAAEKFKRSMPTITPPDRQPVDPDEAILVAGVRRLLGELRATLDFHAQSDPTAAPVRVLITGEGSLLPGLVDHCQATFGLPVRRLDTQTTSSLGTGMNVALGLCLGVAG